MADRTARFLREIEATDRLIQSYLNEVQRLYEAWIRDSMDEFSFEEDPTEQDAILAAMRAGQFPPELRAQLDDVLSIFVQELANMRGRFSISQEDANIAIQLAEVEADGLAADLVAGSTAIASTMAFAAVGGGAVRFGTLTADFIRGRFNRLKASLTTNVAGFRSTFEIRKAQEVDNQPRFQYVGPLDDKTRPFCRHVLTQLPSRLTLEEIFALDRHPDVQLTPVFVYGGGYNCRHRWIYTRRG